MCIKTWWTDYITCWTCFSPRVVGIISRMFHLLMLHPPGQIKCTQYHECGQNPKLTDTWDHTISWDFGWRSERCYLVPPKLVPLGDTAATFLKLPPKGWLFTSCGRVRPEKGLPLGFVANGNFSKSSGGEIAPAPMQVGRLKKHTICKICLTWSKFFNSLKVAVF